MNTCIEWFVSAILLYLGFILFISDEPSCEVYLKVQVYSIRFSRIHYIACAVLPIQSKVEEKGGRIAQRSH